MVEYRRKILPYLLFRKDQKIFGAFLTQEVNLTFVFTLNIRSLQHVAISNSKINNLILFSVIVHLPNDDRCNQKP